MASIKAYSWRPAAWIEVTGEDSFSFLQGQFTNDLRQGGSVYGLWLDRKGKVQADSFVLRAGPERFFLVSYYCSAATITERLEPYIIADDVVLADHTAQARAISAWGEGTDALLQEAAMDLREGVEFREGTVVFRGRRTANGSIEWIFHGEDPQSRAEDMEKRIVTAGGTFLGPTEVESERIAAAIPAIPRDVGPSDLPQEGGLEDSAVSFDKGCYLGQEVMARLHAMGEVRRKLIAVRAETRPSELPARLFRGDREAGEIRSLDATVPARGLAMVRKAALEAGPGFALEADGAVCIHSLDSCS